jgi:hypothetical protein
MIEELTLTSKGLVENPLSAYQPVGGVRELTKEVKLVYQDGDEVLNRSYPEYNNRSFRGRMDEDQRAWLSWTPDPYEGEDSWRWNGVRPITRNRVISTAAHLTAQLIIPNVFAQNSTSEEDREAANVMRELIEYNIRRSNYETAFLFGVVSGLVNPISYFQVSYMESLQEIWNSEKKKEKVIDDVFSGIQNSLIPTDEILFENPYQYEFQKQDWIIHKSLISYGEAEAKYGEHENFKYVQVGKKVVLHDDGLFYDVEDVNDTMVEEVCYKNRRKDLEVYFCGGVYFGDNNVKYNPFVHRTYKNKPKYNIVKFGYEPIDAMRFIGYKSLVAKMSNDQHAADREWQMYFDATTLSTFPPTITMGAGKLDRSVVTPAMNTDLPENAKINPLNIVNPNAARLALLEAERSINDSSSNPQFQGDQEGPQKTKGEAVLLQQNAMTNLGIVSKMIGKMVKEVGELIVDDIVRYQTIGEAGKLAGEMNYKNFVIGGKVSEGKEKSVRIRFTDRYAGKKMTKKEIEVEKYRLASEQGENEVIYDVNPSVFSELDFFVTIDADRMMQKNDAFERAFKLETYDRAILNPLVQQDPESQLSITRDFLFEPLMRGEASKYLPNISKVANQLIPGQVNARPNGSKDLPERVMQSVAMQNTKTSV